MSVPILRAEQGKMPQGLSRQARAAWKANNAPVNEELLMAAAEDALRADDDGAAGADPDGAVRDAANTQVAQLENALENAENTAAGQSTQAAAVAASAGGVASGASSVVRSAFYRIADDIAALNEQIIGLPKGKASEAQRKALNSRRTTMFAKLKTLGRFSDEIRAMRLTGLNYPTGRVGKYVNTTYINGGGPETMERYGATAGRATREQLMHRARDGYTGQGAYFGRWLGSKIGMAPLFDKAENWAIQKLGDYAKSTALTQPRQLEGDGDYPLEESALDSKYDGKGDYRARFAKRGRREVMRGTNAPYVDDDQDGVPDELQVPNPRLDGRRRATNHLINHGTKYHQSNNITFRNSTDETGDHYIEFKEFLMNVRPVTGAEHEVIRTYQLNPGLSDFLPFASNWAGLYSEYDFEQLIFHFESTIATGSDGFQGTIAIGTRYNPLEAPFADQGEMENCGAKSARVTDSLDHGVECDDKKHAMGGFLYVRDGPIGNIGSLHTYDKGYTQIVCSGCTPNRTIGRLYATYRIRLSKVVHAGQRRALALGAGASFGASADAGSEGGAFCTVWTGSSMTQNTALTFPHPDWTRDNRGGLLHGSGVPRFMRTQLQQLEVVLDPATGQLVGPRATRAYNINGYSMSRDVSINSIYLGGGAPRHFLEIVWRAVPGGVYSFTCVYRTQGLLQVIDPVAQPLFNQNLRAINAPTDSISPANPGGRWSARVIRGPITFSDNQISRETAARISGATWEPRADHEVVEPHIASHHNGKSWSVEYTVAVVGQTGGECRLDVEPFADLFAGMSGVQSFGWRFARIQ